MAGISTTVSVNDQLSSVFQAMTSSINACIGTFLDMQQASEQGLSTTQVSNLNAVLVDLNAAVLDYEQSLNDASDSQGKLNEAVSEQGEGLEEAAQKQKKLNEEINKGAQDADKLTSMIKKAVTAYVSIQSIGKVISISDDLAQTTARLDMMNDGAQTTQELTNMIYASAQSARGSFSDMADVVARFGNNASDAFSSNQEVVQFAEIVQKQMTIAGASTQEASNAILQLSQALGSGVLRGDELNSIFEQAPNLIQSIADYLEVPIGDIREMASEGELSAQVVKAAIFNSAEEVDAKFENMDMTWGQLWQSMQNTALMKFQPVLTKINELANNQSIQTFANNALVAVSVFSTLAVNTLNVVSQAADFVADNWSILEPIIAGVVIALGAYITAMTAYNIVQAISNGLKTMAAVFEGIHAASIAMATGATFAQTAAQYGLNAALLACPITWIIIAIIAVIAIIYAVVAAINKVQGTSISATGVILGVLNTGVAFIANLLGGLLTFAMGIFINLYNLVATIANAIGTLFNNPVAGIIELFVGLFDVICGIVQSAAGLIDAVFGSNLADVVQNFRDNVSDWTEDLIGDDEVTVMEKLDQSDVLDKMGLSDHISYTDAYNSGYEKGESIEESLSDLFSDFALTDLPDGITDGLGDITGLTADTASNTGSIADSLEVTEDNLEWMKDIAEREIIDRTVFRDIKVEMGGVNNTVNNMQDLDSIGQYLANSIEEQMAVSAEGA